MNVCSLLVADAQSAELVKPGKTAFNDPSPLAQSAAVLRIASGKPRNDVARAQTLTNCLCIITAVARVRPSLLPSRNCSYRAAIHNRTRPVNSFGPGKPIQDYEMDQLPDSCLLPVA